MTTPVDMGDSDTDDDSDTREVKTIFPGMVILGLQTNKGDIDVRY